MVVSLPTSEILWRSNEPQAKKCFYETESTKRCNWIEQHGRLLTDITFWLKSKAYTARKREPIRDPQSDFLGNTWTDKQTALHAKNWKDRPPTFSGLKWLILSLRRLSHQQALQGCFWQLHEISHFQQKLLSLATSDDSCYMEPTICTLLSYHLFCLHSIDCLQDKF